MRVATFFRNSPLKIPGNLSGMIMKLIMPESNTGKTNVALIVGRCKKCKGAKMGMSENLELK